MRVDAIKVLTKGRCKPKSRHMRNIEALETQLQIYCENSQSSGTVNAKKQSSKTN